MLTELQAAADGLVRVKDLLAHLPVQGRLDLLSALASSELLLLGELLAKGLDADDIAFLKLAVVLGVLLYGVVGQVHVYLVKFLS